MPPSGPRPPPQQQRPRQPTPRPTTQPPTRAPPSPAPAPKSVIDTAILHGMDDLHRAVGLTRNASAADIKKKTRQLSLLVHPDKCDLPNAAEAFNVVSTAARVLPDSTALREHLLERREKRESDQMAREQAESQMRRDNKRQKRRSQQRDQRPQGIHEMPQGKIRSA